MGQAVHKPSANGCFGRSSSFWGVGEKIRFRRNPVARMDRGEAPLTRRLQSSIVIIANCRCVESTL